MGAALAGLGRSVFSLQGALVGGGAAFGVKAAVDAADAYQSLTARLALVTREGTSVESVLGGVAEAAGRARAPASELATVYQRNAKALEDMGRSQEDGIRLAETLAKITTISGASAQQASAGMMQLSQAIASGRFQGDEFRSVAENLPEIMRTLQRETGKSAAELRKLASDGKLTGDVLVNALLNASQRIDADFAKMPQTAGQAFTVLRDDVERTFGRIAQEAGVSESFAKAFNEIREAVAGEAFQGAMRSAADTLKWIADGVRDAAAAAGEAKIQFDAWMKVLSESALYRFGANVATFVKDLAGVTAEIGKSIVGTVFEEETTKAQTYAAELRSVAEWQTKVVSGAPALQASSGGGKLPIKFGSGVDEQAVKRAAKLGDQMRQNLEVERMKYELQQAELAGDETLSTALKNQIEIRTRITDEMRKANPELAKQLEAEILLSNELEKQRELIEKNRQLGERFGEALTSGIRSGIQEGKNFAETLKGIAARMFDIITEVALIQPLVKGLGNSFSTATGGFDFGSIGSSLASAFAFADGGVLNGPTRFAGAGMAGGGLAGEAGPEAILPLRRGPGGTLGVVAAGAGGGNTTVNITVAGDATDATIERMRRVAETVFARGAPGLVRSSVEAVRGEHVRNPGYLRR